MKFSAVCLGSILAFTTSVLGHGDPDTAEAIQRRSTAIAENAALLTRSCAAKRKKRSEIEARHVKRDAFVNSYLESRGMEPNFQTQRDSLATCILAPELTQGPYCKLIFTRHDGK